MKGMRMVKRAEECEKGGRIVRKVEDCENKVTVTTNLLMDSLCS